MESLIHSVADVMTSLTYREWLEILIVVILLSLLVLFRRQKTEIAEKYKSLLDQKIKTYVMDDLTGIASRKYLLDQALEMAESLTNHQLMVVYLIDLDNFKGINDILGHAVGDKILKISAGRIRAALSKTDIIGRFGGDEFVVCHAFECSHNMNNDLSDEAIHEIESLGNKFLNAFKTSFMLDDDKLIKLSISIGIAVYPTHSDNLSDLLVNTDIALRDAKSLGKSQFVLFNNAFKHDSIRRVHIENNMKMAISKGEFTQLYQALIDVQKEKVAGFEALIRWHDSEMGHIGPDEFIPIAEDIGFISEIGRWVYETAIRQMAQWHREGYDIAISINVSPKQFLDLTLGERLSSIIEAEQLPYSCVDLEITETAALNDFTYAQEILTQFRKIGMQISLDDFGTGYSSLNYMKQLPFTNVKIDKSFVDDWDTKQGKDMLSSIISIAHAFDMKLIAEGVETIEQYEFLKQQGCDYVQGYFFSKPLDKYAAQRLMDNFSIQKCVLAANASKSAPMIPQKT